MKHFKYICIAVVISVPLGWVGAMMSTPFWWKLEKTISIELAGHSGPSEAVFIGFIVALFLGIFGLLERGSEKVKTLPQLQQDK